MFFSIADWRLLGCCYPLEKLASFGIWFRLLIISLSWEGLVTLFTGFLMRVYASLYAGTYVASYEVLK